MSIHLPHQRLLGSIRSGRRQRLVPALLVTAVLALGGSDAHAVTAITVDGHPSPVVITVGETVTFRFDVVKANGPVQITMARDIAGTGKWDASFPQAFTQPHNDGSSQDTDATASKVALSVGLGTVRPAGPYLFVVQDQSDNSLAVLPFNLLPKSEAQSIAGRLTVVCDGMPAFSPRDAIVWAYKDSQTAVASASVRSDGTYSLPIPPGNYQLFSEWFGGLRSARQRVTVAPSDQLRNFDLRLIPGQEVNGRVTNGNQPVENALVQATAADGTVYTDRTLADGAYTLALPRGEFRITAPGGSETVRVNDQPIDGVDFPPAPEPPTPAKGTIITVAGNGLPGLGGDGRRATSARVSNTNALVIDRQDNLYYVDITMHRVRVVRNGVMSTVAGISNPEAIRGLVYDFRLSGGFSGDDGPATAALFSGPQALALDPEGNLYVTDVSNHRIRKIDARGIITTYAGSGPVGGAGAFEGDGSHALSARLNRPAGLAADMAGNLFIMDRLNRRVRRVAPDGIITSVAGGGTNPVTDGAVATTVALGNPYYATTDRNGNVYFSDIGLNRLFKLTPDGKISSVAGTGTPGFSGDGGPATAAQITDCFALAADSAGNLFFADRFNQRVRKIAPDGIITTVAGSGPSGAGTVGSFSGDGGPATEARLYSPFGLAIDSQGNLYLGDQTNRRIRKVIGIAAPAIF